MLLEVGVEMLRPPDLYDVPHQSHGGRRGTHWKPNFALSHVPTKAPLAQDVNIRPLEPAFVRSPETEVTRTDFLGHLNTPCTVRKASRVLSIRVILLDPGLVRPLAIPSSTLAASALR